MNLDFTRLDNIAHRTNTEAPRQPASARGIPIHPNIIKGHTEPQRSPQGHTSQSDHEKLVEAAKKIIEEDRINHEIEKGCRLQVLQDIERKANPYWLLLVLAEAVGRLSKCGDSYFLEVKQKLIDVYGHDISEDPVNPDTGFIK